VKTILNDNCYYLEYAVLYTKLNIGIKMKLNFMPISTFLRTVLVLILAACLGFILGYNAVYATEKSHQYSMTIIDFGVGINRLPIALIFELDINSSVMFIKIHAYPTGK